MLLQFQPRPRSSFDPISGIAIPRPRMVPTTLLNGQPGTEYQFAFVRDGKTIGGVGFDGSEQVVENTGHRERIFTFDLGHDHLIQYLVQLKRGLDIPTDDFSFVRGVAEGLVMAFAGQADNEENQRYAVITTGEALSGAAVTAPQDIIRQPRGIILLAETVIPSHDPDVTSKNGRESSMDLNSDAEASYFAKAGISIGTPRMQADPPVGGSREIEYQYSFSQSGRSLTGMGLGGTEYFLQRSGHHERLFTIDLSTDVAVHAALGVKSIVGSAQDDYTFLVDLAEALLAGFKQETGTLLDLRYLVFSRPETLSRLSIRVPADVIPRSDGTISLAEAFVPSDAD